MLMVSNLAGFGARRAAVASAFDPSALYASSEGGFWFDFSDLSTMFQDRAGTTQVTADGQTVGYMLDKSGNGNHWTAPSDAARPLYKTSGGYHWIETDGVDDYGETPSFNRTSWTGGLLVTGHLTATSTTNGCVLSEVSWSPSSANHEPFSNNNWYINFGGDNRIQQTTLSYNTKYVLTSEHASGNTSLRKNGASTGSPVTVTTAFGNSTLKIATNRDSNKLTGKIYSIILRGVSSTSGERDDTEAWVNGKTGAY